MITATVEVPEGWYMLASAGETVSAVPSPTAVVSASAFGVAVSASGPGRVAVSIDLAYRPPTDHVPDGWILRASGTFDAVAELQVVTPNGVVHEQFTEFAQIILPSTITYRMFRRFREDTGLEQHLLELTPAMLLDDQGRPRRRATFAEDAAEADTGVRWEVACPTSIPGRSVGINGVEATRDDALRRVVETGLRLRQQQVPEAGPQSPIFVAMASEFAWVDGFGDPNASNADLARYVVDAIAGERRTTVDRVAAAAIFATRPPVRHQAVASDVRQQWNRIEAWLRQNIPNVDIDGAGDARIAEYVQRTGAEWPDELRELFRCVDGFPRESWISLFPQHELFGLVAMWEARAMMTEIWQSGDARNDPTRVIARTAGKTAWTFLDEFIPIAGMDGNYLIVDTRPGELYGCVSTFDNVDADVAGPQWISISAMLTDLAETLTEGVPFADGWQREIVDGQLRWEYRN